VVLDVARAALRRYRERRLGNKDELWYAIGAIRVGTVLRPYKEALS
jgi:hypothetical protein